jgi:hypothetical protein
MIVIKKINPQVILFVIVISCAFYGNAEAQKGGDWQMVAKSPDGNTDWVNWSTLKRLKDGSRQVEVIKNLKTPHEGARSIHMVSTYHCKKWSVTHGKWTFWSEEWAKGEKLGTMPPNMFPRPKSPGSVGAAVLDAVCTH